MNNKLIKMALDAHLINYIDHETPRVYFINGHADIEDVEKFAELIIQECCRKLENDGMVEVAMEMKEHFGVEE